MFFFFFFFLSFEVPGSSAGVVVHLDAGSVSSSVSFGHPVALAGVGCSVSAADFFFCTSVVGWDLLLVAGGSSFVALAGVVASVEWDVSSVALTLAGSGTSGIDAGLSVVGGGFSVARAVLSGIGSFSSLSVAVSSVAGSSLACSSFALVLTAIAAWFSNIQTSSNKSSLILSLG